MTYTMKCPCCGKKIRFDLYDLDGEEDCYFDLQCGSDCNIEGMSATCSECGEEVDVVLAGTIHSVWTTDFEEVKWE